MMDVQAMYTVHLLLLYMEQRHLFDIFLSGDYRFVLYSMN